MNHAITYLNEGQPFAPAETGSGRVVEMTLEIAGKPIGLRIGALDGPARLVDIIPAAQAICSQISEVICQQQTETGQPVTCSKGCGACCNYLVAISLPEVDYLHQTLSLMDSGFHRSILASCLDAAQAILDNKNINEESNLQEINRWYGQLNLACPFLSDGKCDIYAHRPLVCREHLVTSQPKLCGTTSAQNPEKVEVPVSIGEAVSGLAAELQQTEPEAMILPLALISNDTLSRQNQIFNAIEMTERFVNIIQKMCDQYQKQLASTT
ncbi:MAG: YkgJ family cysteine cluster protein [Planctomycetota bacterium]|jgi:Fe-S-cluster containining protein